MASKRRQRRRSCEGKQRHADRQAAERHAFHLREMGHGQSVAYRCPFCGGWHVGRRRARR